MLERLNRSSSSTSSLERHFVLIVTRAEKPHSQRYVAKGKIILKAFSDSSGYSCEACIQNFIKLTLGCNIFNVVSRNWFNSDVGKFNDSICAINGEETQTVDVPITKVEVKLIHQ